MDAFAAPAARRRSVPVKVGRVEVGGSAPIVVQSMTNTDTADAAATARQVADLARAGSEIVRITVDREEAAAAVPHIKERLLKMGVDVPIVGDFHYIGHKLLAEHPAAAEALDKYRINPGNVGFKEKRDRQFSSIVETAIRQNRGSIGFYEGGIFAIAGETPQLSPLAGPAKAAAAALKDYQEFLEKELLPRSTGEWRLGKERFYRKIELELDSGLSADEKHACDQLAFFYSQGLGYALEMKNRPQSIYAMQDSPIGLAAWLLDHDATSLALIARVFDGEAEGLTRDDILDNVTHYWLTNTGVSSGRLYHESKLGFFDVKNVSVPAAVSTFAREIYQVPKSWAERAYPNLIYFNEVDRGNHFAAWQEPQLFSEEVRAGLRSLR